jgi:hypothetical protein
MRRCGLRQHREARVATRLELFFYPPLVRTNQKKDTGNRFIYTKRQAAGGERMLFRNRKSVFKFNREKF